jgi:hypothetical protein
VYSLLLRDFYLVKNSDHGSELLPRKKSFWMVAATNPTLTIHPQLQAGVFWLFPITKSKN